MSKKKLTIIISKIIYLKIMIMVNVYLVNFNL